MTPSSDTPTPTKRTTATPEGAGFTDDERAAIKERAREVRADATRSRRTGKPKADGESEVLAKIAEMPTQDRVLAERLHAVITANAPQLSPKTWYGMPAYALHGAVVCFFQGAQKFKTRYATLGFSDKANLDNGSMWPTSYALAEFTPDTETTITALIVKATS